MKKINLIIICLIGIIHFSKGQSITPSVINTTGGSIQTSWGSLDFSIGETAVTTIESTNSTVTQGILQPYFFFVSTHEIVDLKNINVYPNPTSDILNISSENSLIEQVILHDVAGKKISVHLTDGNKVNITNLPQGCYILTLLSAGQAHSFTIIKI